MLLAETWIPDLSAIFSHFLAEAILALAVPVIILADLLSGREGRERAPAVLGLAALAAAFFAALFQPAEQGVILTRLLHADGLAQAFRVLVIGTGLLAAAAGLRGGHLPRARTEFFVCLIGAVLGACLTAAANDLAMLYVAIETLSIGGYLLAGFKKDSPAGSEAALKYVIFGAVSSGLMLYGMTLLYGFAGTATIATPRGQEFASIASAAGAAASSPAFLVSIVLVFAGLAYKIAAAPFQFWCPDVYDGSPTPVAAFLAVASKGAGFAAVLRFFGAVTGGGIGEVTDALAANNETVQAVLMIVALATMTVGNLAALRQRNSKRLLAYSAVAHAGYLLMGVAVASGAGAAAVIFYMVVYLFMTLGAFFMVILVERETGRVDIDAFEGLGYRAPVVAACMATCLIGLTGLPPTAGFVGKFFLLREVFAYGANSMLFFWGGVIALLNTVVSLGYYARFLKVMFLCDKERVPTSPFRVAGLDAGLVFVVTLPVLVLGILFQGLQSLAADLAGGIF